MDSLDLPPSGDSRLLSESPQFSLTSVESSSRTGPGGNDLSLSELDPQNCLPQQPIQARNDLKTRPSIAQALGFGLPVSHSHDTSVLGVLEEGGNCDHLGVELEGDDDSVAADVTVRVDKDADPRQMREEKLRSDLFVLRQLNGAFAAYNDALLETQAGTEVRYSPGCCHFAVVN